MSRIGKRVLGWMLVIFVGMTPVQVIAKEKDKKGVENKTDGKPFVDVIKDLNKVEGLFTFYVKPDEGKAYMAIKPEQLNKIYLCSIARTAGDGTYYDNGADWGEFPIMFKRVGQNIQMIQVNLRFRADSTSTLAKAIERGVSNSIYGAAKIESAPHKDDGALLVNASAYFIQDVNNTSYFLGKNRQLEYSFDKDNSYLGTIKSFPNNSEIDAILHFKTNKPNDAITIPSPYSMIHIYHFSLSTLPETDYRPRLADERVGYFQTVYQDYSRLDTETPYVRYINRWNLQKLYPDSLLSPPKEPIVFWLENTIPVEYRPYVANGVLLWNKAFEKIGFKDAIVVKQMPDTATWDPADVRYNTIRWVIYPGQSYAVGPSRTNPFTGQIYDADIRVCVDFIRHMYTFSEYSIDPHHGLNQNFIPNPGDKINSRFCEYGIKGAENAAFAYSILSARSDFDEKSEITKKYVEQYITDLVNHEVGHTLGLRHNFKASSIHSPEQIYDTSLVAIEGISGSVMDYNLEIIAPPGVAQGDFYHLGPGSYDYWAIEYGYKPIKADTPEEEKPELDKIAGRCGEPLLVYGTDEDAMGTSAKGIDPLCSQFDMSSNPLEYFKGQMDLSKELWGKIETKLGKPGYRYQKMMAAFSRAFRPYRLAAQMAPRFVGGIYRNNCHVGDPGAGIPFEPVPAAKQKEAMRFVGQYILAAEAFQFPATLLNKLQPERLEDLGEAMGKGDRIDYPIHNVVFNIQKTPIDYFFDPITLSRLQDIELRFDRGEPKYTMADMFNELRGAVWSELSTGQNINSFRRPLQKYHLEKLINLVIERQPGIPEDARTLARNDLILIKKGIATAMLNTSLNLSTSSHLEESRARIEAALEAGLILNRK
ncbi:MAG: DUF5117 domain-containing protein [candidate division Zixibacteria bacterium]|nr:DUF5117 domain-containing protein [candidate division Zixibacteria bacterium]